MKGTAWEKLKYWGELQLGLLLLTGSVYFFKAPNGFATGGYTGEDKSVLICVCSRLDAARLKRRIKELDPDAFIIVTSSSEILGRGFRSVGD